MLNKKHFHLKPLYAFLIGVVLTVVLLGTVGTLGQGKFKVGGVELNQGLFECQLDNCDVNDNLEANAAWLMDAIEELHDEVGYSTWTLEALAIRMMENLVWNLDYVEDDIADLHDEVGYSTYTLASIGAAVNETHNQLGYSTWTLSSLASAVYNAKVDLRSQLGYSTWTLEALAAQMYNVCN